MRTKKMNSDIIYVVELDDFIVGDDGQPIKSKKKKKHIIHSDA